MISRAKTIDLRSLSRSKAAAIHFCISFGVAALVAALVFLVWYPAELVPVTGGLSLFVILVSVDVSLGPLMTLIVFNPAKKSLKFDLAVIVVVQLTALAYGLYVVSEARPAYVVFVIDRFEVVSAAEIPKRELSRVKDPHYRNMPWFGPRYVAAERPATEEERSRILFASVHGVDLQQFPEYYVPYEVQAKRAAERAISVDMLMKDDTGRKERLMAFLTKQGLSQDEVAYLPLHARVSDAAMLVRKQTGKIVGVLPISPW